MTQVQGMDPQAAIAGQPSRAQADRDLLLDALDVSTWEWDFRTGLVRFDRRRGLDGNLAAVPNPIPFEQFLEQVDPADRPRLEAAVEQAKSTGWYECGYRLRLGARVFELLSRGTLERAPGGEPVRLRGIGIDISSRRQAEADRTERQHALRALEESEAQFRAMFDVSSVGKAQIDPVTACFLRVNPAFCRFLGCTEAELLARTLADVTHPGDHARDREGMRRLTTGEIATYDVETRFVRRDTQAMVWGHLTVNAIRDASGRILRHTAIIQDVSARKEMEAALRESEAFSRVVLEHSPDCVQLIDAQGRIQFMNLNGQRLAELEDFEAVRGRIWWDLWPEAARETARTAAREALGGGLARFEALGATARGTPKWWEVIIRRLPEVPGSEARLICVSRDITDRKLAAAELAASEERFRLVAAATHDALWDIDLATGVVWWNEAYDQLIGPRPPSLNGSIDWWRERLHPEDRACVEASLEVALSGTGSQWQAEYRIVRAADQIVYVLDRAHILRDARGRPLRIVGAMLDLTARKRAETLLHDRNLQLDLLARVSQRLILSGEPEQVLESLFGEMAEFLDMEMFYYYRPGEEPRVLRLKASGGTTAEEQRLFATMRYGELLCGRVAETRRSLVVEDLAHSSQPGCELLAAAGAKSYAGFALVARGELLGTLAFISRRRAYFREGELQMIQTLCDQIAATLERARLVQALQVADRQKDEFLAMLAHELRNPLAPIMNAMALLATRFEGEAGARVPIEMIGRQTRQLTRLVDDLLDLSRIAQGRIELKREALELGRILEQAVEMTRPLLREKEQRFVIEKPAEPLYVHGDFTRLVQSLANVLHNAAKYTDVRGHIRLEVEPVAGEIELRVADDGSGISPELLPHVFDLFVQSERTLDRSQGGLGIGLSVVKRLVEMHGGSVAAASAGPGRGATFTIRLPRIDAPAETPSAVAPPRAPPRRILVVDDNADAADSLAMLLGAEGHEVHAVYGAQAALEAAIRARPEVVFLDIGLPQMDGYDVARRLRSSLPHVRLVALTGYGRAEDRERAREAGFDHHLVKPADPAALEGILAGDGRS